MDLLLLQAASRAPLLLRQHDAVSQYVPKLCWIAMGLCRCCMLTRSSVLRCR
jgi:hypothetical protein